ncbi:MULTISPECIES: flagellar motor switch protein FliN [unclassified Oceanispirochaeta]|uniref:flagellar motor switch protein FliN n=1 Tax=unclassified Oceanispirochaeta TaxID=2635722 RepID=UPI000E090852|nr:MULTISPECIES: flagellar motor switch protein FliN [unclassified Oceanispirochaeta]MBF9016164.1 flagellar motor switch protein FliN [Oceanispirochaeta sp. M2]NPD72626.1 flagellar motor switch protein FliN [Oceanispirochaeta sp. M1]RDG31777.1 flagellar motor switch protein FliN [Oceanispirochaeta sp. M1]
MSDGSLSQDEIDALLMGNDSLGGMDDMGSGASAGGLGSSELEALNGLFSKVVGNLSSTMSGLMSTGVTIKPPVIESLSRDGVLAQLSNEIVEVKMDFNQGLSGGHVFVFSPENAVKIAGPMIGQEDVELDGTAISAVGEAVSQITGSEVTVIGDTVKSNIMTISPESQKIAKGLLSTGGDTLVKITYPVEIEGQGSLEMVEILELSVAADLAAKLGASPETSGAVDPMAAMGMGGNAGMGSPMGGGMPDMNQQQQMMGNQMGGMGMPQQQMMGNQMGGMGMPQQQMGMPQQQMGMGQQQMGMGQQMNPYMMQQNAAPNVQGVQFPEFGGNISPSEQRNIGLLMDVSMELTVELGRTKWQIKDILGIGEGTIIELDKLAGEPVDILVNNNLIAKGEVVVIDENFGVRVTDIVSNLDKMGEQ